MLTKAFSGLDLSLLLNACYIWGTQYISCLFIIRNDDPNIRIELAIFQLHHQAPIVLSLGRHLWGSRNWIFREIVREKERLTGHIDFNVM